MKEASCRPMALPLAPRGQGNMPAVTTWASFSPQTPRHDTVCVLLLRNAAPGSQCCSFSFRVPRLSRLTRAHDGSQSLYWRKLPSQLMKCPNVSALHLHTSSSVCIRKLLLLWDDLEKNVMRWTRPLYPVPTHPWGQSVAFRKGLFSLKPFGMLGQNWGHCLLVSVRQKRLSIYIYPLSFRKIIWNFSINLHIREPPHLSSPTVWSPQAQVAAGRFLGLLP